MTEILKDEKLEKLKIMVGEILKKIREKQECSLDELSEICGVSAVRISKLEKGEVNIDKRDVRNIALGFGLTFSEFMEIVRRYDDGESIDELLNDYPPLEEKLPIDKFGPLMREIRETYGYTRGEAAKILGVSIGTLFKIEQKGQEPRSKIYRAIIQAMWNEEKNSIDIDDEPESKYNIGEVIDNYLYKNLISYRELADNANLSYLYVSNLWRNKKDPKTGKLIVPTIEEFVSLAGAMNMSINELAKKAGYMELYEPKVKGE